MSFNRLKYDICEEKNELKESMGPGLYQVTEPVLCGTCYQDNPQIRLQKNGDSMNTDVDWRFNAGPIDIDSELRNLNRAASRCPKDKFTPDCPDCDCGDTQGEPCGQGVVSGCKRKDGKMLTQGQMCGDQNLINFPTCHFSVEDSRLSNPPCTLRGTGWNRFQPLCLDPQDQVLFPGDYQVPTRLVVKDNHRPCVPTPAVNNMLPQQRRLPCLKTDSTCASYTSPSYQYDVCG